VSLLLRNLIFTVVVPGFGAVYAPYLILTRGRDSPTPVAWQAIALVVIGGALYLSCLWVFAMVGRGTPGPWDAPRRFVAVGPYRWVRNPMYIAALLVVLGEAWLFGSLPLLAYAAAMAAFFHLFVVGYEEPRLRRSFGGAYLEYQRGIRRWIPRPPRAPSSTK
jgi:protein-S-isoprenylcysteine O-methyltransferase Ste14